MQNSNNHNSRTTRNFEAWDAPIEASQKIIQNEHQKHSDRTKIVPTFICTIFWGFPIGRRNKNAVHSWLPGYTFSQKSYTGVTSPLRMHIQMSSIQRNGRCGLSCMRNLILTMYLLDIWSIYCWSHGFVQCALIEARVIHLIYFLSSAKSLQTGFSITSSISYNLF